MRTLLLIIPMLFLVACGFHPVYGVNKYTPVGAETRFEQIEIANIPNREGQYLRNALIDRFYRNQRPTIPKFELSIKPIRETRRNLDITIDSDTTRGQLKVETNMLLRDIKTREILFQRKLDSTASYNVLNSEFANRISEQKTRENLLDDLARQIEMQTALYLKRD